MREHIAYYFATSFTTELQLLWTNHTACFCLVALSVTRYYNSCVNTCVWYLFYFVDTFYILVIKLWIYYILFSLLILERLSVAGGVTVFFWETHVNLLSFMPICYRNLVFRSDNSRNMYIYEPEISILFSIFGKNVTVGLLIGIRMNIPLEASLRHL